MITMLQIALSLIPGLSTSDRRHVEESLENERSLLNLSLHELEILCNKNLSKISYRPDALIKSAEEILEWTHKNTIKIVSFNDTQYPPQLREIYNPPYLLYVKGKLIPTDKPCLGVVGTRKSTLQEEAAAFSLGLESGFAKLPLLSGLARGIDYSAHSGSVAAEGLTWGILACGVGVPYPNSSRYLATAICENGGGLISEYPPLSPPVTWHFPERNRILSGLSRSIVVISAPEKSGALITAEYALDQGRDLYIHSESLGNDNSIGTKKLADEGANVISSLKDVYNDWGWPVDTLCRLHRIHPGDYTALELYNFEKKGLAHKFQNYWFLRECQNER